MALTPSIWRTCRVLANPLRLACLRAVVRQPEATVEEVAQAIQAAPAVASLYLRHLQARGLLATRRQSRWVHYVAQSDASVRHAGRILAAVRAALRREQPPFARIRRHLTAFTHPRRLALLTALLVRQAATFDTLLQDTGMSHQALVRHLDKLQRHGLICRAGGIWCLAPSPDPLAGALLRCLQPRRRARTAR